MSYEFDGENAVVTKVDALYEKMQYVKDQLESIAEWSRETTHDLYKPVENQEDDSLYVKDYKQDWEGPSDDYILAKAWEIIAVLNG